MRKLFTLILTAGLTVAGSAMAQEPLSDADYEHLFYSSAHDALISVLSTEDDAAYALQFHAAAESALVQSLDAATAGSHDDASYEHLFHQTTLKAVRYYDAPDRFAQTLN